MTASTARSLPDRPRRHSVGWRAGTVVAAAVVVTALVFAAVAVVHALRPGVTRARSVPAATAAAAWLAGQVNAAGYIPLSASGTSGSKTAPDLSDTAQAVLALAATGRQPAAARRGLDYLEGHVHAATAETSGHRRVVDPGSVAVLILDAHALDADPRHFGGVDLVATLVATMRRSGTDAGLFGAASPAYDGAYQQGLALAALAGAGHVSTTTVAPAIAWLQRQQCASGAWQAYRATTRAPCAHRDPSAYRGPDTNSTSLAVEGLTAWHAHLAHSPLPFLRAVQDRSGGWAYYGDPAPTDTDSTAVVRQALVALGAAGSKSFVRPGGTPLSALTRNQITSGPAAGALAYQPGKGGKLSPNLLATEQAVPALEQVAVPFGPRRAGS